MMSEYTKQAKEFLKKTGAKMTISYKDYAPYFEGEKEYRNIYRVRIDRNGKSWSFNFGDSIASTNNGDRPTAYDVLACITKYEPAADVWDFAEEYGYNIDSRQEYNKVNRIYKAVCREYKNAVRMFGDVLDDLAEIQ